MAQFAPLAIELPQLLVSLKSAEFTPVNAIPFRLRAALPAFKSVTVCAGLEVPTSWELKFRLTGERVTNGPPLAVSQTPERLISCGLLGLLSVRVTAPVLVPVAVGVNVTLTEQFAPGRTLPPQVLVWAKSPLVATLDIVNGAPPVFVNVTVCGALVVPTVRPANVRLEGTRLATTLNLLTRLATLTVPIPVAKSHPVPAANAG